MSSFGVSEVVLDSKSTILISVGRYVFGFSEFFMLSLSAEFTVSTALAVARFP